jgi:hypothetical protein
LYITKAFKKKTEQILEKIVTLLFVTVVVVMIVLSVGQLEERGKKGMHSFSYKTERLLFTKRMKFLSRNNFIETKNEKL